MSQFAAPRKSLGQNFLQDPNIINKIVRALNVQPGDTVLEIGPGTGTLTRALVGAGASVVAYEVDRSLRLLLNDVVEGLDVELRFEDALAADWAGEFSEGRWKMVANLPYNVATPLVCDLLDDVPAVTSMLVMVQREVAERLAAQPGSKQYGAVSVKVAYWATASVVGTVPASVFVPRPNVESALVRIDRHDPPATDQERLFALVRRAFGQRRKMLRRSLADAIEPGVFESAAVDPRARPEQLDLDAWCRLADAASDAHDHPR